ncbi:MAG: DUF305 domain-containing protein [Anaerolineae bacterium]|nr:DUF305 domain-containing protein [Anaerolineae bacterium]
MRKLVLFVFLLTVALYPSMANADGPISGRAGRSEVRFLEGMIDHHQMALDMANDCLQKAKTESVVTLCNNIISAQTGEIKQMQDWLLQWYNIDYKPMAMAHMMELMGDDSMGGMDHSNMGSAPDTDPAMMMGMMAGLNRLEGVEYETAFLEAMIDHHDDALHMSERILKSAEHAELRTMAETIIEDQTAEIEAMEQLITELGIK